MPCIRKANAEQFKPCYLGFHKGFPSSLKEKTRHFYIFYDIGGGARRERTRTTSPFCIEVTGSTSITANNTRIGC